MRLSLIVKGNKFAAARAAADRGIPFAFIRETGMNETVGFTPETFRDKVIDWYDEDGGGDRLAPFPAGTLMLFSEA